MKRGFTTAILIAGAMAYIAGCGSPKPLPTGASSGNDANTTSASSNPSQAESTDTPEAIVESSSTEAEPSPPVDISKVSIETVDVAAYDAAVAEMKGNVVLVDFWATWCLPCMERFPETVAWSKTHAPEGLKVISVSMDSADSVDSVKEFLAEQKADFRHLMSEWGAGSKSMENFKIQGGGVPYYRLYDRQGKLRYEFSGNPESLDNVESFEKIEPRIKELLAEAAT